jgi:CRP-like cAMP-binding protein
MSRLVEVLQPASVRAGRLSATEAFAGLAWPDLEFAAGILTETLVDRGARMTVQDRPSAKLWLILEGEARLIRVAGRGDLVGLTSLFYATNSPETTIALSSIRAFGAGPAEFRQLLKHRPIRQRLASAAKKRGFMAG